MNIMCYIAPLLLLSAVLLIKAEFRNQRQKIYVLKPLSTLLVIIVALSSFFQPAYNFGFSLLIVAGLTLSLLGDVFLMFPDNAKAFRLGLANFLLAHVIYTIAFWKVGDPNIYLGIPLLIMLILGSGFYRLVRQNLGAMRIPVIAYISIISVMLVVAFGTLGLSDQAGTMIFAGAILFYISDMILAASRFWQPRKYNRISLAFYYSGQVLIAASTIVIVH